MSGIRSVIIIIIKMININKGNMNWPAQPKLGVGC